MANIYAAKMSHTVLLAKPLSAQLVASAGEARTSPDTAASATPARPSTAGEIGSVMMPVMTAANNAK